MLRGKKLKETDLYKSIGDWPLPYFSFDSNALLFAGGLAILPVKV